ncbi:zf-HC2 domain-containing protein [bacterium]|nr:zf-HC2 domain-containing protein [bacterium]
MPDSSLNEQLIVDYLLGDLPEAEAGRLDQLSVTDDEFAEFLEAVESELIDDYIRGELPENRRARFESHYLTSATRLEKVAVARTIVRRADNADSSAQLKEWIRPVRLAPTRTYQWIAIAAAMVMLVLAGYLLLTNIRLQNQIAQMKEEHAGLKKREEQLQRDLTQRSSLDRQKETELAITKEKLEALEKQLADHGSAPVKLFAFTLSPQQREIATSPDVKIPAATESLVVTLKLERDDFPMYQTVLKNSATDEILWQSKSEQSINGKVVVTFPAKILKPQDYILELSGITKSGHTEIISGYPFRALVQ